MRRGICVDCDTTVEINEHGKCATCGSSSIMKMQFNKAMNAMTPILELDDVLKAVDTIMVKIGHAEAGGTEQAAMQFISARLARMAGLTLGQHLENTLSIWEMCTEVEAMEVKDEKGN